MGCPPRPLYRLAWAVSVGTLDKGEGMAGIVGGTLQGAHHWLQPSGLFWMVGTATLPRTEGISVTPWHFQTKEVERWGIVSSAPSPIPTSGTASS